MQRKKIATLLACVTIGMMGAVFADTEWSYDRNSDLGPSDWGKHYSDCRPGGFQSPINIRPTDITGKESLPVSLRFQALTGRLADDGHSVKLNPVAKFVAVGKTFYSPLQFHFHSLAETQLNGHQSAAEIHFVTQNGSDQYLVLAILVEPGASNKALGRVLNNTKQDEMFFSQKEVAGLFPKNLDYRLFEGSLTNPPCSRGITWIVFTHAITASQTQIKQLQEEFQDGNTNYYRPLQDVNHRPILSGHALRPDMSS